MAYDIFISYRRDGGEYTAKILRDRLQDSGYRAFFDVESLRSGDFNTKLYSVIDECTDFLLILSPGALDRCRNEDDWVRREVEYALEKGKNVIPVMLRSFSFPDELPASLEPLRYRNGLEANSQFFDAFLQQLKGKFLLTKPTLWHRLRQNSVVHRTLPVFLALALILALVFAVKTWTDHRNARYPSTNTERNLTDELLYYTTRNLTSLDLMGDALDDALNTAKRYVSSGEDSGDNLQSRLEANRQTIENLDPEQGAPTAGFLDRMAQTPFALEDIEGLYSCVVLFRSECISYLDHIQWMVGPDCHMTVEDKLETLDCYQTILDETLLGYAYSCNELLLPVTEETALESFWYQHIPELMVLPLDASRWESSREVLESKIMQATNRMEAALLDVSQMIGNLYMENLETAAENAALEESIIETYMAQGYSREDAQTMLELVLELRQACLPLPEDGVNLLWEKMSYLLKYGFYDDAQDCVDAYWAWMRDDPDAQQYIPALTALIDYCRQHGVTYGVMVMAYADENAIHDRLRIGDMIVSFNGVPCVSYEDYMERKTSLQGTTYEVEVLRKTDSGEMETLTIELSTDMPGVYLNTVVYPD